MINKKFKNRLRRKLRIKMKIRGTSNRPRLSVFRSNRFIYAQVIDDSFGKSLFLASDKGLDSTEAGLTKIKKAAVLGKLVSEKLLKLKIKKLVFDRNGYKYHGRVKALAEGVRAGGLTL